MSYYSQTGQRIAELAVTGIRLVIEEFRSDVTKTLKDGRRGKLRIAYGDPHKPQDAVAWTWKFIDGARTAGDLYGRALVVIAAQQHASRLVVPQSQRHHPFGWGSHKGHAAKALKKLAGPHLPASLTALERAVKKAHAEHEKAVQDARQAHAAEHPATADAEHAEDAEDGEDADSGEDGFDEDHSDVDPDEPLAP